MRYNPYASHSTKIAPTPLSYGLVRCWIPSIGMSPHRNIHNRCYNGGASEIDVNGSDLNLGTGVNCLNGDGPKIYSNGPNGWPYLLFDGSDDSARCRIGSNPVIVEVDVNTYVTYAFAFRRIALSTNAIQFGFSEVASTLLRIRPSSDGNLYFDLHNSGGSQRYGRFACNDLNWHFVVFTFDGSQATDATKLQGYLDGTPQSLTFSATALPSSTDTNGACWIGFDDTTNLSTAGEMNFAAIWNRHLERSDVQYLYQEWRSGYPTFLRNAGLRRQTPIAPIAPAGRLHYRSKLDGLGSGGQFYNNPLS